MEEILKQKTEFKQKGNRLKIGIDIDEVVTEYVVELLNYLEKTRNKKVNYEDIEDYYFVKPFNMSIEEIGDLIKEHTTDDVIYNLDLIEKAKESIDSLKEKHYIYFITSRPLENKKATYDFFNKHFPEHNFEIIFSGDAWKNGNKSKSEICEELGIDILIEDNKDYVLNCAEKGVNCFLFDKPWNRNDTRCEEHQNIYRVYHWNDILNKIKEFENNISQENSFDILKEIKKFVEDIFGSNEAKYKESYQNHFIPVVNYVKKLGYEFNLDKEKIEIIEISAWLHDIGSIVYGRENHHITSTEIAEKKLKELNYPKEKIELVKKCILNHRGSVNNKRDSLEEQILVEADTMSAFDNIEGLFQAALLWEKLNQKEARNSVKEKLKRKYNQLSEKSKELIKPKYDAAMLLFD